MIVLVLVRKPGNPGHGSLLQCRSMVFFYPFYFLPGKFRRTTVLKLFSTVILKVWHKCSKPISRYSTALNIAVFPVKWQYERGILFTSTVVFQNVTPTSSHYLQIDVWSSGWNVALSQRVSWVQSWFCHIKPSVVSLKWNTVMYTHMNHCIHTTICE